MQIRKPGAPSKPSATQPKAPAKANPATAQASKSSPLGWLPNPAALAHKVEDKVENLLTQTFGSAYPDATHWAARGKDIQAQVKKMSLTPQQAKPLADLAAQGISPVDVWQGSHLVFNDGGKLYDKWAALGATPRFSSHYPDVKTQQYEIKIGHSALLFGKDAKGNTWAQMEAYAFEGFDPKHLDLGNLAGHGLGYLEYKATGENIGPMGRSPHTEHHDPLRVNYKATP